jgi:hypothetical protein
MLSLREAARATGFPDPVISVQRLTSPYFLGPSPSLRDLIGDLVPEQVTFNTGEMKAGDVKGWAALTIFSNGQWLLRGHVHDSGTILGDDYVFVIALNYVDASGQALAVTEKGTLKITSSKARNDDWGQQGAERRIKANWHNYASHGATWRLRATTDLDALGKILLEIGGVLATGGFILLATTFGPHIKADECRQETDPVTGREVLTCPIDWRSN